MNPSFMAFHKAATGYVLNSIAGIPYVSKKSQLAQTDGKLFATKAPRSDMVEEAEAAEKEALVNTYLDNLAKEAKARSLGK